MNSTDPRLLRSLSLLVLSFSTVCSSTTPTRLCEGFQSYQTLTDVQADLRNRGLPDGWTEKSRGTGPNDRRTPYKMTELSGPTKLLGNQGFLTLTFYNGRLMQTRFSPQRGDDFKAALRRNGISIPPRPDEETVTDRRTRFRFGISADGQLFFTWYDPQLQDEWTKWVASNS